MHRVNSAGSRTSFAGVILGLYTMLQGGVDGREQISRLGHQLLRLAHRAGLRESVTVRYRPIRWLTMCYTALQQRDSSTSTLV